MIVNTPLLLGFDGVIIELEPEAEHSHQNHLLDIKSSFMTRECDICVDLSLSQGDNIENFMAESSRDLKSFFTHSRRSKLHTFT